MSKLHQEFSDLYRLSSQVADSIRVRQEPDEEDDDEEDEERREDSGDEDEDNEVGYSE